MIPTAQRRLALLFAAAITLALWSHTLSGLVQPNAAMATSAAPAQHFVLAAAPAAPVLM